MHIPFLLCSLLRPRHCLSWESITRASFDPTGLPPSSCIIAIMTNPNLIDEERPLSDARDGQTQEHVVSVPNPLTQAEECQDLVSLQRAETIVSHVGISQLTVYSSSDTSILLPRKASMTLTQNDSPQRKKTGSRQPQGSRRSLQVNWNRARHHRQSGQPAVPRKSRIAWSTTPTVMVKRSAPIACTWPFARHICTTYKTVRAPCAMPRAPLRFLDSPPPH